MIFECLKYRIRKQSKQKKVVQAARPSTETDFDMDDLVCFFESCILPRDSNKLKDKLAETADWRRDVLAQDQRNFPKMFNFYSVDPNLVSISCSDFWPKRKKRVCFRVCVMFAMY